MVADNIDGSSLVARAGVRLCARPAGLSTTSGSDSLPSAPSGCGAGLAAVNTTLPTGAGEAYVVTFSAADTAGNAAAAVHRWVIVTAR